MYDDKPEPLPLELRLAQSEAKYKELAECYEQVLCSARRAARDLLHCLEELPHSSAFKESFRDRHRHYELIFGGTREYVSKLHYEIRNLDCKLGAALREIEVLKGKLPPDDPNQQVIPF